ncbi:MAG: ABC transporter permease [Deltaproteobacteria bacterium]|jgi:general nucleoside transport system permease protein|nr:ABC transporter permease [Deltaproteobacteria bacterium]MBT4638082.1 ABC transporter permease [Deltaproteobacteria bacterium]MBT6503425.1 ABC transporter permease [Deltaproteobacteria bacterium]MBT7155129.1 ABC transporter permease [Deltaproteobacteria bacterium]
MFMKKYEIFILPVVSVFAAMLVGAVLIFAVGENPLVVYWIFFKNSLFSLNGIGYTLFYATPLIFTGLSVAFGFRCGLFNIGAEGQLYVAAMAVTLSAIWMDGWSAWIVIPVCLTVSVVAGGIWGGIPGLLKARFGGHEVINTIMMNLIAFSLVNYLVVGPFHREGTQILETDFIPVAARIPRVHELIPIIPKTLPLNMGFVVALLACLVTYLILWKTRWGYEIRAVGISNSVSKYAGINVNKNMVMAMFIAGGFAGMVAIPEVMGYRYTFHDSFSAGVGFIGIAVALLGRNHPVGVILAALLFGALIRGSLFLDLNFDNLSKDLVMVLQGVIVLFVASDKLFKKLLSLVRIR